jgi:hypothetical protein
MLKVLALRRTLESIYLEEFGVLMINYSKRLIHKVYNVGYFHQLQRVFSFERDDKKCCIAVLFHSIQSVPVFYQEITLLVKSSMTNSPSVKCHKIYLDYILHSEIYLSTFHIQFVELRMQWYGLMLCIDDNRILLKTSNIKMSNKQLLWKPRICGETK